MEKEVRFYKTPGGKEPFLDWLYSLNDDTIRYRIRARIKRIKHGNYGDHKRFYGIIEIRMHFAKGYRLYCAEDSDTVVILLAGGDKSSQSKDINEAIGYWRDYHEQNKI